MKMKRKQVKELIKEINSQLAAEENLLQEAGFYAGNAPTADELYRLMGGACKLDEDAIGKLLGMLNIKLPGGISKSIAANFNFAMKMIGIPHKVCALAAIAAGADRSKISKTGDMGGSGSDSGDRTPGGIFQNYILDLVKKSNLQGKIASVFATSGDSKKGKFNVKQPTDYETKLSDMKSSKNSSSPKDMLGDVEDWFGSPSSQGLGRVRIDVSKRNLEKIIRSKSDGGSLRADDQQALNEEIIKYFVKANKHIVNLAEKTGDTLPDGFQAYKTAVDGSSP